MLIPVRSSFDFQKKLTTITLGLFLMKAIAWYFTGSLAVLSDTLEYSINVVSSFLGMYSLRLSSRPKDKNHPYGHGKVEFLSATMEGTLMIGSGIFLIYEITRHWLNPHPIGKLDVGLIFLAISGLINYWAGYLAVQKGEKNHSLALVASGRHMISDTYATAGILAGLVIMYLTGWQWVDGVVAALFAVLVMHAGYKILRTSVGGIMDEADLELLREVVTFLQNVRRENWVDLHNLRIIKYGGTLHLDCHLTVPWYFNVHEAHHEIDQLDNLIRKQFGRELEFFVHTDGCLDFSCKICSKANCPVRKFELKKTVIWNLDNVSENQKHRE